MRKILLIYNPCSGKATIKNYIADIIEILTEKGDIVTTFPTRYQEHAKEITQQYALNFDLVVCCGGDGTLNEAINGLMTLKNPPSLGYIPSGTVNDFANSLEISKNPKEVAKSIISGTSIPIDIGTLNNTAFSYFAGFGLFTNVSYQTPQESKNILGRTAYILEGIKILNSIPTYKITIETEKEVIIGDFVFGMITNSVTVGGFKKITSENVKLDDGLFEIMLAYKPKTIADCQAIAQSLLTKTYNPKCIYRTSVNSAHIMSDDLISYNIDGEYAGTYTDVNIKNHMHALNLLTNKH